MIEPTSRGVPIAYRPPFALGTTPYVDHRPCGESILEMVLSVPNLPERFFDCGSVCINGEIVPRDRWSRVRPKLASAECPIAVTLHWPLAGGGGGGGSTGKAVGGLVAAFALVVLTAGAAGGLFSALAPEFLGAGSIGAKILAGTIGISGGLGSSDLRGL